MTTYKITFTDTDFTGYPYEVVAESATEANKSVDGILAELKAEYPAKEFNHDSTRAI